MIAKCLMAYPAPHCAAVLTKEDITVIMFPRATVLACPRCKKSLSLNLADL